MTTNDSLNQFLCLKQQAINYLFQYDVLIQEIEEEMVNILTYLTNDVLFLEDLKKETDTVLTNIKSKTQSAYALLEKGLIPFTDIDALHKRYGNESDLFKHLVVVWFTKRQSLLNERFQAYSKAFEQWKGEVAHG